MHDTRPRPYEDLSLWLTQAGDLEPRGSLPRSIEVDVAIVGAGFTGLWCAYYLKQAAPSLDIAIVEKEIAGFGASGRNGGWCFGHLSGSTDRYAEGSTRDAAIALRRAGYATVDILGATLAAEGIDAGFVKSGALVLARSEAQTRRLKAKLAHERSWGLGEDIVRWADAADVEQRISIPGCVGALEFVPAARVHPGRLVRGLALTVERMGVRIYEQTEVQRIDAGRLRTSHGDVRASLLIRGTEAYTGQIAGEGRRLQPLTSQIIATEPLAQSVWDQIGWAGLEAVADSERLNIYAQRTIDDRIAIGGRGGKRPRAGGADEDALRDGRVFDALRRALVELFPAAASAAVSDAWAGVWGATRDWCPVVAFDRDRGLAWAGGYGDGLAASNLAARTIVDLWLDRDTELARLPWVNRRSPSWPPDPLPRIGAWLVSSALGRADAAERRGGRVPWWEPVVQRVSRLADK